MSGRASCARRRRSRAVERSALDRKALCSPPQREPCDASRDLGRDVTTLLRVDWPCCGTRHRGCVSVRLLIGEKQRNGRRDLSRKTRKKQNNKRKAEGTGRKEGHRESEQERLELAHVCMFSIS